MRPARLQWATVGFRVIVGALFAVLLWAESKEAISAEHLRLGIAAQQHGNAQLAIEEFRKSAEADPSRAETHARLGMVYQSTGMLPQAALALEKALAVDPNLPQVGILLAFTYQSMGRNQDAIPYLAKALENESDPRVRVLAGLRLVDLYFATHDSEHGLEVVEKLRRLAPKDPAVLYTASKVYANLWNSTVELLLNTAPDSYRVHQVFAEVFEAQDRFADAAKEYRQIIQMEPTLPGAHYRLGRMILRNGDNPENDQKALAEFKKELEIQPDDIPSYLEIGEINLRAQHLDEAEKEFSHALSAQSGNVRAMVGLGGVNLARKQYAKALEQLQPAAKIAPEDSSIRYSMMLAYRSLGRAADAQREYAEFQKLKTAEQQRQSSMLNQLKGLPVQTQSSRP
jgi:tetratricopeptide (TPR) repeat protein